MNAEQETKPTQLDTIQRLDLAKRLASGLVGWMHSMSARMCGHLADEDAARLEVCQILHAQRTAFYIRKNVIPVAWKERDRHLDVGLGTLKDNDPTYFGAVELKWSSTAASSSVRVDIVQDIARLVAVNPDKPAIRFLLAGGDLDLDEIFVEEHHNATVKNQRDFLHDLLAQKLNDPNRSVALADLQSVFSNCFNRLPASASREYSAIKTTLLADAKLDRSWNDPDRTDGVVVETFGRVRVWQVDPDLIQR